ncbi:hypothetical protein LCGC14_2642400 [marine sediment metagenome]|uniref:Methyltransferase domain-containing protein n=1 Tax=marine sediment metagenome TaxID=412755 RepID=A0A0F9AJK6_9ZZZZ
MTILNESQLDRDKELAYFTGKSLEEIQKIEMATPISIKIYDEKEEIKPENYIELYTDYKFLDMTAHIKTVMNRSAKSRHRELFNLLKTTKNKVCLDYGSGVGTHAIALAENNNRITLYDVEGSELLRFAIERMVHRFLPFNVLVHTDNLPQQKYDVVICTDVLEHVAEPLRELLRITDALKRGGTLHLLVSTMRKPSSGHFSTSIDLWIKEGIPFMEEYFIKEGQTIYRKK